MLVKGVTFHLESDLSPETRFLLEDFRLAVNNAMRAGLRSRATSMNPLTKLAYEDFRQNHPRMYAKHLGSVFEVAASVLKNHRRRTRNSIDTRIPYVNRLMMKAGNQAYKLDRQSGILDLPIRAGCHVKLKLVVSQYHRKYLDDIALTLGSLTGLPAKVIVTFRKEDLKPYIPESVLSMDTNEGSLDGVFVQGDDTSVASASFPA